MAQTFTIAEIAKTTGVTKQTVTRHARDLGIFDAMQVVDARGTRAMTAEQASMLADAVTKASPDGMKAVRDEADKAHAEQVSSDMLSALLATIESQRQTIQDLMTSNRDLMASQEQSRLNHEAEVARLTDRLAKAESDLRGAQACITELAAAHWWEKKRIVARYALPAPRDGE